VGGFSPVSVAGNLDFSGGCAFPAVRCIAPTYGGAGLLNQSVGLFSRPDPLVVVRSVVPLPIDRGEAGDAIQGGAALVRVAACASLSDFDQSNRNEFTNCSRDGVAMNSVLFEVVEGAGQPSVVSPGVVAVLNNETPKRVARGRGQSKERLAGE
jgi:hypothetical protein